MLLPETSDPGHRRVGSVKTAAILFRGVGHTDRCQGMNPTAADEGRGLVQRSLSRSDVVTQRGRSGSAIRRSRHSSRERGCQAALGKSLSADPSEEAYGPKARVGPHEFVNGEVFAIVGASKAHNGICLNLATALNTRLRGGPCRPYMSDVKVRIRTGQDDRFYYPDLLVS